MAAHRLLLVLGLFGRAGALCTSAGAACAGGVPGWVRIADSPGKGRGAFASVAIPPRQTVGDYRGELISQREIDARYEGGSPTAEDEQWRASRLARGISLGGDYIARVAEDLFVDAEDPACSSWCRYINHDANPNLALKVLPKGMDGKPRAWFVTLRAVSAGEELYWDYGPEFWSEEDDGVASGFDAPIRQRINEGAALNDADAFAQWAALQAGGGGEG